VEPPLSDLLRSETRQAHHALDHHPALKSLVSARIDAQAYRASLESLYRSWAPLEIAIEQSLAEQDPGHFASPADNAEDADWLRFCLNSYFPRRYALARDLKKLGASPAHSDLVRFRFSILPELAGGLYVCFGAQMGGKFIAAHLARNIPDAPTGFFESTHSDLGTFWIEFKHQLDSFCESDEARSASVHAANRVFDVFRSELG
jgi:heme oxygenase